VQEFQVLRVLEPALKMKAQTLTAEVGKILFVKNLFVEKRRKRLHIGECKGTRKPVIPWVRVGSGFYSLFLHCLRAEMPFRCKQAFPKEENCLDLLQSVLHNYYLSFPTQGLKTLNLSGKGES
jgi:hypothetical protein